MPTGEPTRAAAGRDRRGQLTAADECRDLAEPATSPLRRCPRARPRAGASTPGSARPPIRPARRWRTTSVAWNETDATPPTRPGIKRQHDVQCLDRAPGTFVTATVFDLPAWRCSSAATVSAVVPEAEIPTARVPGGRVRRRARGMLRPGGDARGRSRAEAVSAANAAAVRGRRRDRAGQRNGRAGCRGAVGVERSREPFRRKHVGEEELRIHVSSLCRRGRGIEPLGEHAGRVEGLAPLLATSRARRSLGR